MVIYHKKLFNSGHSSNHLNLSYLVFLQQEMELDGSPLHLLR